MGVEVVVAGIGAFGLIVAAAVPAVLARRDIKHIKQNVGTTNGQGPLAVMAELILANQKDHATLDAVQFNALNDGQAALLSEQARVRDELRALQEANARADALVRAITGHADGIVVATKAARVAEHVVTEERVNEHTDEAVAPIVPHE